VRNGQQLLALQLFELLAISKPAPFWRSQQPLEKTGGREEKMVKNGPT
jgi:hypothetical protein